MGVLVWAGRSVSWEQESWEEMGKDRRRARKKGGDWARQGLG